MGFPSTVNVQPAIGVAGDFASTNPRFTVDAGAGALVAGPGGVTVGRFAWATYPSDPDGSPSVVNNFGVGQVTGFVHREQQALITQFLADSTMLIPAGMPLTLFSGGDFFAKNDGSSRAVVGNKAYADSSTGKVLFAATGQTPETASVTGTITAQTSAFTGSISDDILTVTAVSSGTLQPGSTLSGTGGGGVANGTKIVAQLSSSAAGGALGSTGVYAVSINEQTVTSTAIAGTWGILNVTAVSSGALAFGAVLSGTGGGGVTAGSTIAAVAGVNGVGLTGTGNTGTYGVDPTQGVTATTISASLAVETKFVAMSSGIAGDLIKISSHPLG